MLTTYDVTIHNPADQINIYTTLAVSDLKHPLKEDEVMATVHAALTPGIGVADMINLLIPLAFKLLCKAARL